MIITELLAVLSISAAVGFRLALPLLLIGLVSGDLWSKVPILSWLPPTIVVGALVSGTLIELIFSKDRHAQRLLPSIELFLSPLVGAIAGIAVGRSFQLAPLAAFWLGILGGLLALVIHLVQVGWLYRMKRPSPLVIFGEDFLCACLVLLAFDAPHQGGLIALFLLWLALRTSRIWHLWYRAQSPLHPSKRPRRLIKRDSD